MRGFIGIDPGVTGFIGYIRMKPEDGDRPDRWDVGTVPLPAEGRDLAAALQDLLCDVPCGDENVVVERITPRAPFSIQSQWKLAYSYGVICSTLSIMEQPYTLRRPQDWQSDMDCLTRGDKHITRDLAAKLFPQLKPTLKNGDALCLAEYARRLQWPDLMVKACG